jgi:hypothetical protein
MSQHFNKFMRLNADNSFTLRVFLNCVGYICCIMQHVNNISFPKKKKSRKCARVTRDPVSGFRVGIANLRKRGRWGDPDVDGRIILRWMLRTWAGVVGAGGS